MSLWFSASAVSPLLRVEWGLSDSASTWLTLSVQLGFVAGTLVSAVLNLPDIWAPRQLVVGAGLLGAAANAGLALFAHGPVTALVLRFLTGFFLAGVYPPGMKILATWFKARRGLALGVLIGALSLGKGVPYLANAVFGSDVVSMPASNPNAQSSSSIATPSSAFIAGSISSNRSTTGWSGPSSWPDAMRNRIA